MERLYCLAVCTARAIEATKHDADGRVIIVEFESFLLLNTYAPNNGWKEEENSFQRRRKWDKRMSEFVQQVDKPLIWCGDLNVSHDEIDVSHPDFFSDAKLNGYIPPNKEVLFALKMQFWVILVNPVHVPQNSSVGNNFYLAIIPCASFDSHLYAAAAYQANPNGSAIPRGKLVDAYRYLHKEKDMECGFSWSGNPVGKYRGKRMRIDYFVISEGLKDRIVSCEMHGHGIELEGFYGSDHCPVSLVLSKEAAEAPESKSSS
ncbi:DNA-(apurinic or apyrimidinic site) lyase [Triticum urartu]|uniref:DNA-(Apurinic or apyrimidinic site) lyase n=1 Tax=Triticum urartu TaxID=4572 RepID=M7Z4M8_TRIUA|nr:DNA-(apurinic or apyrimidinic site) lyase [Triticum urartu]